ncbi:MAG: LysR family transcriptional regulator, partial [Erysipelotrichaceae bacterium]|nr:LysR family transcriptional regulator [Erysipelotrichaceae bacterium]
MDIRVLKYFLAVAQEENITKASEILHTTQPNVSRQIADLEKELGKPLFNRNGRTLTLTQEGMFLRRRAQEIVELVERTEEDFLHIDEVINGTIHIGAIETDAMHFFGDIFLDIHNTFPGIKYNL